MDETSVEKSSVVLREKTEKKSEYLKCDDCERLVSSLSELSPGDHIVISVDEKTYCHAILETIMGNVLEIIYFDDGKDASFIKNFIWKVDESKKDEKVETNELNEGVKKIDIVANLNSLKIYKVNYENTQMISLSVEETLAKASKLS